MLYQWGRKDAFPGADGSTITQETNANNAQTIPMYGATDNELAEGSEEGLQLIDVTTSGVIGNNNTSFTYAIKHPLTFIYNILSLRDWYTNDQQYQNDVLWTRKDNKSNYDPCPEGWRMPLDNTWNDFTLETAHYHTQGNLTSLGDNSATNGLLYKDFAWYSACGYRNAGTGNGGLRSVGYGGNYWSSTPSTRFNFNPVNGVSPNYKPDEARAAGLTVRCIQE